MDSKLIDRWALPTKLSAQGLDLALQCRQLSTKAGDLVLDSLVQGFLQLSRGGQDGGLSRLSFIQPGEEAGQASAAAGRDHQLHDVASASGIGGLQHRPTGGTDGKGSGQYLRADGEHEIGQHRSDAIRSNLHHFADQNMLQVADDNFLLDQTMADMAAADPLYRPTNYWQGKCAACADYVKETGLLDFRGRNGDKGHPGRLLASFGGTDGHAPVRECFDAVGRQTGAVPITDLPAHRVGNPNGIEVDGRFYTQVWLNYYLRYSFVARHMDLNGKTIVEIGSGSAKQAHMVKMAHPDATIVLFDIAPQVYLADRYLSAACPEQYAGYAEMRDVTDFSQIRKGKINLFGAWKTPMLAGQAFDLLWNAASFQEMEPDVVTNYLTLAGGARNVFLMEMMTGQTGGVLEKTTMATYAAALPKHKLVTDQFAALALPYQRKGWTYRDTFWTR